MTETLTTTTAETTATINLTAVKLDALAAMRQQYAELMEAFKAQNATLIAAMEALEANIKEDTLKNGETIKGESLMAVWVDGKTTYDSKALKALEAEIPQIANCKKKGNPSVSFKAIA